MRTIILLLAVFVYACDRSEEVGSPADPERPDREGTAASYDRTFFLLAGPADAPVAAVFEFSAVEAPEAIRRTAGAWVARDGGWRRLMSAAWAAEPVREPWRLVPHGALRLIVGEGDEIEALVHRSDSAGFRLSPSEPLGEWGVGDAVQVRLRRGEFRLDQEVIAGLLLDVQTGAPVTRAGEAELAFVTDSQGASLVAARGDDGRALAWLHRGAEALSWDAVTLAPAADSGAAAVPPAGAWRIDEPTGDLKGELVPAGEPLPTAGPPGGPGGARTVLVRGWIEARGDRRPVFGILRHARE